MVGFEPIDGETPIDVSHLKAAGVTNRRELNIVEAQNIARAVLKHLGRKPNRRTAPFTLNWCLSLHRDMFGDVWDWAGKIRNENLSLGVPFQQVQTALYDLTQDLAAWGQSGMQVLEQAVRLQHRAVAIHPFPNGNGRWSRLMANILLKREGHSLIEWPETTLGNSSPARDEYLAAIRAADNGQYEALINLCGRYCQRKLAVPRPANRRRDRRHDKQ